jgi:16S rRNA (cytidine1402-2'-O)-methyltransferase
VTKASTESAGTLYIVATPIGNVDDLSPRARQVLAAAALIAAEDTRRSGRLLARLGLKQALVSLHEHNETRRAAELVDTLEAGRDIALVSDAGTPLISDPGFALVQAAIERGLPVVAIPGPSAVTAALSVAGLPTDRFVFEGFLPRKADRRRTRLAELAHEPRTLVLFEAVHRVAATLSDMAAAFGDDRRAVLARELTKLHEQVARGTLASLGAELGQTIALRGEFVLVVEGARQQASLTDAEVDRVYALLVRELPPARAVALCASICGRSRNEVYALTRS